MSRTLLFLAVVSLGLAPACNLNFGPGSDKPEKKHVKEFYDRVPQEADKPSLPTN